MKKLVVTPITNRICYDTVRETKNGLITIGEHNDITDECIKGVFQWFINNFKKNKYKKEIRLSLSGIEEYELVFRMKNTENKKEVKNIEKVESAFAISKESNYETSNM